MLVFLWQCYLYLDYKFFISSLEQQDIEWLLCQWESIETVDTDSESTCWWQHVIRELRASRSHCLFFRRHRDSLAAACASKRDNWSIGSFNSVRWRTFPYSFVVMKSSETVSEAWVFRFSLSQWRHSNWVTVNEVGWINVSSTNSSEKALMMWPTSV